MRKLLYGVSLPLVVLIVLMILQEVRADGKYFPEQAYKKSPAIPSQRAIIVYKDGTEKLTIESSLEGEGKEFGWIIPLPGQPTKFEKATPGLIKTLSQCIQPKITHDLTLLFKPYYLIAAIFTLWFLLAIVIKPKRPLAVLFLVFIVMLLLISVFMPSLGVATRGMEIKSIEVPGVRVRDVQEIGSYKLVVLDADSAGALDGWLTGNGFVGLSEKEKEIVSDYIKHNWCFVAAKLIREGEGYSRPHPLSMVFECKEPVYPMRMTAMANNPVYVELFVIAEKKATSSILPLEYSDEFRFVSEIRDNYWTEESLDGFMGSQFRQMIGHPDSLKDLWDSCVLSKLCGTLKPSQMGEDIILELRAGRPFRKHYYSWRGARETGLLVGLNTWWFSLMVLTFALRKKINAENGRKFALLRIVLPLALFCLLLGGVTYAVLPKIEVKIDEGKASILGRFWPGEIYHEAETIIKKYNGFQGMDREKIEKCVKEYFTKEIEHEEYPGLKCQKGDSPGEYEIKEDERGVVIRFYHRDGFPYDFVLKSSEDQVNGRE